MSGQEEDKKPAGDSAVHINLKVKGQDGNEVFFRIKRNTQLKKLMNAYCDRQSVDISSIAFLFDGRRLRPDFEETYEYSIDMPDLIAFKDADFSNVEAVFCCWPHGTTQEIIKGLRSSLKIAGIYFSLYRQEIIKGLPSSLKIADLSEDFRLRDADEYEEWYGQPHKAIELQKETVYGLTEISRSEIQSARLIANPGCYPTSVQLPLIPLIKANLIEVKNIIIDSKSGVCGAWTMVLSLSNCIIDKNAKIGKDVIVANKYEIADVEEEEISDVESEEEVDDESEKVKGTQGVIQIDNPNLAKPKNMKARDVDVS
ncbi:hypothetical protein CASFOL_040161 [Castilleja foliolosa]|uniref:Ubiquitin-like domain-containing protein n=1 Tax=Castilleja foliolosa TaxID=1961234 RepID=A0ABD3BEW7_9LAMI